MKVNYFQELICEDYISINSEILDYVNRLDIVEQSTVFWNPLNVTDMMKFAPSFLKWTCEQKLKIYSVALTIGKNNYPVRIHVDTPPARFKLSWPILNSDNSFNRWFKVISADPKIEKNPLGGTVYTNISDLQEICRRRVNFPAIIDAGTPHDVVFEGEIIMPRLGLQCQLLMEPRSL
jgi:hypothetical protein